MLIYTTVFNGLAPTTIPCIDSIKWLANLRVLEVTEIQTVPYVPLSHAFVERLIGTIRREFLDRTLFWTTQIWRRNSLGSNITITDTEPTPAWKEDCPSRLLKGQQHEKTSRPTALAETLPGVVS